MLLGGTARGDVGHLRHYAATWWGVVDRRVMDRNWSGKLKILADFVENVSATS